MRREYIYDPNLGEMVERPVKTQRHLTQDEQFCLERAWSKDEGIRIISRVYFGNGEYGFRYITLALRLASR